MAAWRRRGWCRRRRGRDWRAARRGAGRPACSTARARLSSPGRTIGHERQAADPHDVIGRERRQAVVRRRARAGRRPRPNGSSADARPPRHVGRCAYITRCRKASLVGASPPTGGRPASSCDSRAGSSAPSEALVGVISQPPSGWRTRDVAGRAERQAALEQRGADRADRARAAPLRASCALTDSSAQAFRKKSGAPKLPDFSASATSGRRAAARPGHAGIDLRADRQRLDARAR